MSSSSSSTSVNVISVGTPDVVQSDPNVIKTYLGEELEAWEQLQCAAHSLSDVTGHQGSLVLRAEALHSFS